MTSNKNNLYYVWVANVSTKCWHICESIPVQSADNREHRHGKSIVSMWCHYQSSGEIIQRQYLYIKCHMLSLDDKKITIFDWPSTFISFLCWYLPSKIITSSKFKGAWHENLKKLVLLKLADKVSFDLNISSSLKKLQTCISFRSNMKNCAYKCHLLFYLVWWPRFLISKQHFHC